MRSKKGPELLNHIPVRLVKAFLELSIEQCMTPGFVNVIQEIETCCNHALRALHLCKRLE
jgi:hypothetical protein